MFCDYNHKIMLISERIYKYMEEKGIYQNLSISAQKRLEGYLDAINDLNK